MEKVLEGIKQVRKELRQELSKIPISKRKKKVKNIVSDLVNAESILSDNICSKCGSLIDKEGNCIKDVSHENKTLHNL